MTNPTGTLVNIYHICHRQLWLHGKQIQMEHNSDLVKEGKLIHETTYIQRAKKHKELDLGFIKIDHYNAKEKIIHEVKKSNKKEVAYVAQLKYYIYHLEQMGINGVRGILEYPKLRITKEVILTENDRQQIPFWNKEIQYLLTQENCPPTINKPICKNCSYQEFCYS